MVKLEICCGDFHSLLAAFEGGADRAELCMGLPEGGLTPSAGLLAMAEAVTIRKHILIRPRSGDFLYDEAELRQMEADIRAAHKAGADAIVCGALTPQGDVDMQAMCRFIEAADGLPLTFHRAFDLCRCPDEALEQIVELGCASLLTSGCAPTAVEGADTIRRLQQKAGHRIEIIAAAGITPDNAAQVVSHTGVSAVHASASGWTDSRMQFRSTAATMGPADNPDYRRRTTMASTVRTLRNLLDTME